jgi:hypothetical protein
VEINLGGGSTRPPTRGLASPTDKRGPPMHTVRSRMLQLHTTKLYTPSPGTRKHSSARRFTGHAPGAELFPQETPARDATEVIYDIPDEGTKALGSLTMAREIGPATIVRKAFIVLRLQVHRPGIEE